MPDPIWDEAKKLCDRVNAAIDLRCLSASPMQYRAIAEEEAEKEIDGDRWEYFFRYRFGDWPPHVAIMRCLQPPPRGKPCSQ